MATGFKCPIYAQRTHQLLFFFFCYSDKVAARVLSCTQKIWDLKWEDAAKIKFQPWPQPNRYHTITLKSKFNFSPDLHLHQNSSLLCKNFINLYLFNAAAVFFNMLRKKETVLAGKSLSVRRTRKFYWAPLAKTVIPLPMRHIYRHYRTGQSSTVSSVISLFYNALFSQLIYCLTAI